MTEMRNTVPSMDLPADVAIGPVVLHLPADPHLSRVLRLAAGGVAAMGNFTVDEVEDIKIAVSEVMLALIEHGGGLPIDVQLCVYDDHRGEAFHVVASTRADQLDVNHPDLLLCSTVLEGVCTAHGIDVIDGEAVIWAAVAHSGDDSAPGVLR
jgi:hypothetical protein